MSYTNGCHADRYIEGGVAQLMTEIQRISWRWERAGRPGPVS